MDITKYFKKSNDKLDDRVLNYFVPCSLTSSVLSATRQMNSVEVEQDCKKKRQVLPKKVKKDVGYSWKHGNPEATRWASKKHPDCTFKERLLEIRRKNIRTHLKITK